MPVIFPGCDLGVALAIGFLVLCGRLRSQTGAALAACLLLLFKKTSQKTTLLVERPVAVLGAGCSVRASDASRVTVFPLLVGDLSIRVAIFAL